MLRSPEDEPDLDLLLARGELLWNKKIKTFPGTRNCSHENAACLWIMEQANIATGFAYDQHIDMSFQHSWGIYGETSDPTPEDFIIETTVKFQDYWGVELNLPETQRFVISRVILLVKKDFYKQGGLDAFVASAGIPTTIYKS